MIQIGCPNIGNEEIHAVTRVLSSRKISNGEIVRQFERQFAEYIGKRYAIAVCSGSVALELSMKVSGLKKGDKVLVSPFNCAAVLYSIINQGIEPVFVDIDPETFNISPNLAKEKCRNVQGVIIVHLFGHPCEMDELLELKTKNNLIMIEDFAQAPGAIYKESKTGTFGDLSICSFGATKCLTTAEGGIILTDEEDQYNKLNDLKNNTSGDVGYSLYNYKMNDIQAAIGLQQLKKYEDILKRKREIANFYFANINNSKIITPVIRDYVQHAFHSFVIKCENGRNLLHEYLKEKDIETSLVYKKPLNKFRVSPNNISQPVSEQCAREVLSLPIHSCLSDEECSLIVEALESF